MLFCSFPSWPVCHLGWLAGWLPIWMVKKQTQYKSSLNIWYVMRHNNCSDTETRESRKGRERAVLLFCCFSILLFCHWFCCLVYLGWSAGWLPSNKKKPKFESETNKIESEEIKKKFYKYKEKQFIKQRQRKCSDFICISKYKYNLLSKYKYYKRVGDVKDK